jgi:RNA polymerase-binding protein DksA
LTSRRTVEELKRLVPPHLLNDRKEPEKPEKKQGKRRATKRSSRKVVGDNGTGRIEVPKPLPKTNLRAEELAYFRKKLLEKRHELFANVQTMESEALRKNRSEAAGDLSQMPIHMADIGTDNYEQEFSIGLIQNERTLLKEIDDALKRIQDETYGVCLATHQPISKARLRAKPWASYCIEYKRSQENGRRNGAK